jgi:hypothetical protein
MAERTTKTAKEGYIFTQVEDVAIEQRVWGKVIDTAHLDQFHEVLIEQFEEWQAEMDKLRPMEASVTNLTKSDYE